jgi:hypothetical protein
LVDFLSIAPPETRKEVVAILDHQGAERQVEIQPVDNSDIAKLARKHPGLRDLFKQNAANEQRMVAFIEHMPAIVAAALGHLGDEKYEAAAKRLAPAESQKLIDRIMEISFGSGGEKENDPLPTAEEVIADATAAASDTQ